MAFFSTKILVATEGVESAAPVAYDEPRRISGMREAQELLDEVEKEIEDGGGPRG